MSRRARTWGPTRDAKYSPGAGTIGGGLGAYLNGVGADEPSRRRQRRRLHPHSALSGSGDPFFAEQVLYCLITTPGLTVWRSEDTESDGITTARIRREMGMKSRAQRNHLDDILRWLNNEKFAHYEFDPLYDHDGLRWWPTSRAYGLAPRELPASHRYV